MNLRASADASRIRICQDVSDAEKSFEKAGAIRIAVKDGLSHIFHRSPSRKWSEKCLGLLIRRLTISLDVSLPLLMEIN